ncbi:hypothetical protein [Streptomyces sp. NPDC005209]|uniref:hypothetical protein n=1 Tax=Streptomyces sp. NPDC005209 TaxID=3156715 RepID=UPI0033A1EE34
MTNIDMKPENANDTDIDIATETDTYTAEATPGAQAPHHKDSKKNKGTKKNKARRRTAKALAYFALIFSGLLVLAEPWLLLPVAALLLAISLWD